MAWTHLTYREAGTADHKSNLVDLTKELEKAHLVCAMPAELNSDFINCCTP